MLDNCSKDCTHALSQPEQSNSVAAASVDSDDDDQIDEVDDVQGKYELHILNSIT